jgi:hypothetical protein
LDQLIVQLLKNAVILLRLGTWLPMGVFVMDYHFLFHRRGDVRRRLLSVQYEPVAVTRLLESPEI